MKLREVRRGILRNFIQGPKEPVEAEFCELEVVRGTQSMCVGEFRSDLY